MSTCKGTTIKGERCTKLVKNEKFCYLHQSQAANCSAIPQANSVKSSESSFTLDLTLESNFALDLTKEEQDMIFSTTTHMSGNVTSTEFHFECVCEASAHNIPVQFYMLGVCLSKMANVAQQPNRSATTTKIACKSDDAQPTAERSAKTTKIACDSDGAPLQCPICLDCLENSTNTKVLEPCGHRVHDECCQGMRTANCPMCRVKVTNWGNDLNKKIKKRIAQERRERRAEDESYASSLR